ncbi:hypothetical protein Ddye_012271 [Dipteronia dyeriana]|uniref:Uncharacterized protein n=1 Tax=Dipteronia dyeriana TaxID=168575 RepID=A0AAD9X455_9ROSI|nr:hypothetical protein Ddye_012271 [Dipteronia dyeriana]
MKVAAKLVNPSRPSHHQIKPYKSSMMFMEISGFDYELVLAGIQKMRVSQKSTATDDNKISIWPRREGHAMEDENDTSIVYYGPISSTINKVKFPIFRPAAFQYL